MKKRYAIFLIILSGYILQSCNDWLDLLPPQDLVQDEYWKSGEDVKSVLMGAYSSLQDLDEFFFLTGELRADMISVVANKSSYINTNYNKLFPEDWLCKWDKYYIGINRANYVLDFIDLAVKNDSRLRNNPVERSSLVGEALFVRSFLYFYLVKLYGEVPLVLESSKSDNQNFYVPKVSEDSVLNQITRDLLKARSMVKVEHQTVEETKGRATKASVDALLADIYLWREDYNNCVKYCDYINDSTQYFLVEGENWYDIFYPGNSLEGIFEIQFNQGDNQSGKLYDQTYSSSYWYSPTSNVIERFVVQPGSLNTEIIRGSGTLTNAYPYKIWKYAGITNDGKTTRSGSDIKSANWIVYRLADIYLMKAEALTQLGRFNEALELVNIIRTRSLQEPLNFPGSKEAMEDLVLDERTNELAFEGKRWWDLMRMGKRDNYRRKKDFIEIIIENAPAVDRLVLANRLLDTQGWYWPINETELELNPNLIQNPYYESYAKK